MREEREEDRGRGDNKYDKRGGENKNGQEKN